MTLEVPRVLDEALFLPGHEYVGCPTCAHPVDATEHVPRAIARTTGLTAAILRAGAHPEAVAAELEHASHDAWMEAEMVARSSPAYRRLLRALHDAEHARAAATRPRAARRTRRSVST